MPQKDNDSEPIEKLDDKAFQAAIEEKVRQMLDPEIKDPELAAVPETDAVTDTATAPEIKITVASDETTADVPEVVDAEESPAGNDALAEESAVVSPEKALPAEEEATAHDQPDEPVETEAPAETIEKPETPPATLPLTHKPNVFRRFGRGVKSWFKSPLKRRLTLGSLFVAVLAIGMVPSSRYFALNVAGVRSSASLIVVDKSTQQPLKNVAVQMGTRSGTTDKDGKVSLDGLKLGKNKLVIKKRAFASSEQFITLGWGSNPLGDFTIQPTGSQYSFIITDYLSGKPIPKAEAIGEDASAYADEAGKVTLTMDVDDNQTTSEIIIQAEGYRQEKVTLNLDSTDDIELAMAPAKSHVFISRRSGKYDVYKINADGKNEERVIAGSGVERDDLVLVPHPTKDFAAMVSTRENVRNRDGFLLSTLTLIDVSEQSPTKVAQSERIQIIDWFGDRLVYVQISDGASAVSPDRHRLMSYDLESDQAKELAQANYFNDVIAVGNHIFYAPSSAYSSDKPAFYKISPDGSSKQAVFNDEVWNVYRTDYDKLALVVGQDWHEYQISNNKVIRLSGEPANLRSRVYVGGLDGQRALWVDQRDGKGVLLAYDLATKEDKVLHEQSGLTNPVRWLSRSTVIYRVTTGSETADYVMSLEGGEPRKLKDVTNTAGIDRWYYY